ncbi:MAG TPA: molybdate ABC transporter substrate-binding protein [Burkholderiaceae bacterium]|nr:molybdate ABC transporter substrate-binding protein [Burkholderiaceae bacterium]
MRRIERRLLIASALLAAVALARAAEVRVAVASNFAAPMKAIAAQFEQATGHHARVSLGATGAFYAQIRHGAPFEVLLAADAATPARLVADGAADAGSRFTYAVGRLVLWSARADRVDAQGATLRAPPRAGERLAIANPRLAPYGAAAEQVLERQGVAALWRDRRVQGENIAQTHQFVASGNAALGFVALAQVVAPDGGFASGSGWRVPESLHDPIRQDAVLLARGRANPAAAALLQYLRSDAARRVIAAHGYGLAAP